MKTQTEEEAPDPKPYAWIAAIIIVAILSLTSGYFIHSVSTTPPNQQSQFYSWFIPMLVATVTGAILIILQVQKSRRENMPFIIAELAASDQKNTNSLRFQNIGKGAATNIEWGVRIYLKLPEFVICCTLLGLNYKSDTFLRFHSNEVSLGEKASKTVKSEIPVKCSSSTLPLYLTVYISFDRIDSRIRRSYVNKVSFDNAGNRTGKVERVSKKSFEDVIESIKKWENDLKIKPPDPSPRL